MDMLPIFTEALGIVLSGAMQIVTIPGAVLSRFGALEMILTLIFIFIFIKRMFGKYNSGASDTARKSKPKGNSSK